VAAFLAKFQAKTINDCNKEEVQVSRRNGILLYSILIDVQKNEDDVENISIGTCVKRNREIDG
jgi:hypothetical protein